MGRAAITGVGVVSPIGNNFAEVMAAIGTGRKGIGKIRGFNTDYFPTDVGAEVKGDGARFLTGPHIDRKEVFIKQAMAELFAGCENIHAYPPANRFLNLGVSLDYFDLPGFVGSPDAARGDWQKYSHSSLDIATELARANKIDGGFTVNVTACVASTQAIGLSFRMLKGLSAGNAIITGGFDSVFNPLHYMGFYKLGALSTWRGDPAEACRPFDKNRSGLVLGEGAGVFLLQDTEDENVLPGRVLAEIVGYGSTMDAYMVTDPHPEGKYLAKAALNAIEEAGITPDDIDCVHLHGTGTPKNARAETNAMRRIFPDRWADVPVFSMKGQIGHLIGACGALEMVGVIYSLQKQQVPATVNFADPDPEVPLRIIKGKPLDMDIDYVLKLNSAFGGQNAALVVKKYVP
jgi:3-oxoacyl-(acyl-carrier-protein) synthase